jgi:hypothetical protein
MKNINEKFKGEPLIPRKARTANRTFVKGGVSCSADIFVVTQILVFQIKFCGKSPALRVAARG